MTEARSLCARSGVSEIHLTGGRDPVAGRRREVVSSTQPYADNEQEWIDRARSGDLDAFDLLMRRHQASIYALVRRMVRHDEAAEELTQDVFLKAYEGLGRFREEAAFSTWLYRIALNHVRDYIASRRARDLKRETSLEDLELSGFNPVSTSPDPEHATSLAEMAALFDSALRRLEPRLLEAFLLRHQESLPYEQIALVLEISVVNAKVRVHRARERILEELRSLGYDV